MRISMRKQRRAARGRGDLGRSVLGPGALPNLQRICGHKIGAPTPQKGVRCGRPNTEIGMFRRQGQELPLNFPVPLQYNALPRSDQRAALN